VTDREFGFLRVMLVAPVRRSALLIGKCLGGAVVGLIQGALVVALGGLANVPYDPVLIATLLAELLLLSFSLTAFGVLLAVHVKRMQSFLAIMQLTVTPMYFMSGALFPVDDLPVWLSTMTRLDPLAYAVDPMRRAVFARLGVPVAGLTWGGQVVSVPLELGLVAALALVALLLATRRFERSE
jgi:ABC-2 type transport system permease protein